MPKTACNQLTWQCPFVRKWRLKCRAVADSLAEAGDKLFTFTRLSKSQWKSARTTNAIERLNEEFKRRIKTQTVLPCPETVPMLLWALLASGQIQMRKVDGWETLDQLIADETLDRAAWPPQNSTRSERRQNQFPPLSRHNLARALLTTPPKGEKDWDYLKERRLSSSALLRREPKKDKWIKARQWDDIPAYGSRLRACSLRHRRQPVWWATMTVFSYGAAAIKCTYGLGISLMTGSLLASPRKQ
jgi:hypothetical protein